MRPRRGETVPALLSYRLASLPAVIEVIICAVLAALAILSTPDTLRKVGRLAAAAQIITGS